MAMITISFGEATAQEVGHIHEAAGKASIDSLIDEYHNPIGVSFGNGLYNDVILPLMLNPSRDFIPISGIERLGYVGYKSNLINDLIRKETFRLIADGTAIVSWDDPRIKNLPGYRPDLEKE